MGGVSNRNAALLCYIPMVGWIAAIVLWPWLQIGNPLLQFKVAFELFANHPNSFEMPVWGTRVVTTALPWWYVPGELLARLPEGFLVLLMTGLLSGVAIATGTPPAVGRSASTAGARGIKKS